MQRFELLGRAGAGANSTVFKCRDTVSGAVVAVKKLEGNAPDQNLQQVLHEAAIMRLCAHKHTVELLEAHQAAGSGSVYLVMENVEHSLARELLLNPRGLTLPRAKLIAFQLSQALEVMHSKQVAHCDIKPANILLTGQYSVKLCDFGSARATQPMLLTTPDGAAAAAAGVGDDPMGAAAAATPPPPPPAAAASRWYCAPESLLGGEASAASDMWALGCILAELLAGKPLMPGSDEELDQLCWVLATIGRLAPGQEAILQLLPAEGRGRLEAARARGPLLERIPKVGGCPQLAELLRACLHPDPAARPTAAQLQAMPFFDDLRAAMAASEAASVAAGVGGGSAGASPPLTRRPSACAMDVDTPAPAAAVAGTTAGPCDAAVAAAATTAAPPRRLGGVQAAARPTPRPRVSALTANIRGRGPFEGDGAYTDLMPGVLRLVARWEMAAADEGLGPIALAARHSFSTPFATISSGELPLAPQALGVSIGAGGGSSAAMPAWPSFGSTGGGGGGGGSGVIAAVAATATPADLASAAAASAAALTPACSTPIAAAAGGCGSAWHALAVTMATTTAAATAAGPPAASAGPSPMECTPLSAVPARAGSPIPISSCTTAQPSSSDATATATDPAAAAAAAAPTLSTAAAAAAASVKATIASIGHVPYMSKVASRLASSSADGADPAAAAAATAAGRCASPAFGGSAAAASGLAALSPAQLRSRAIVNRARRHASNAHTHALHLQNQLQANHPHRAHHNRSGSLPSAAAFLASASSSSPRTSGLGASATLMQQELLRASGGAELRSSSPYHRALQRVGGGGGPPPVGRPTLGSRPSGHATRRSFADLSDLASVAEYAPLTCEPPHDSKRMRRIGGSGSGLAAPLEASAATSLGAASLLGCEVGSLGSLPENAPFLAGGLDAVPGGGGGGSGAPRRRMRRSSSGISIAASGGAFLTGTGSPVRPNPNGWQALQAARGISLPQPIAGRRGGAECGTGRGLADSLSSDINNSAASELAYLRGEEACRL